MSQIRMSSRTRKQTLLGALALIILSTFSTNAFAAAPVLKPIPASTPTSVLFSQVQCGYFPNADGRETVGFFSATLNGLNFDRTKSTVDIKLVAKPTRVTRTNGSTDAVTQSLMNAQAGSTVKVAASSLISYIDIEFPTTNVPSGKVSYSIFLQGNGDLLTVTQKDNTGAWAAHTYVNTYSGSTPGGGVQTVLDIPYRSSTNFFGSRGLFFPVNKITKVDTTSPTYNANADVPIEENIYFRGGVYWGRNQLAKSTVKLTYVLPDKTGCEGMTYIEIK